MLTKQETTRALQALPFLNRAEPALVSEFQRQAFFARIPAGRDVFLEGDRTDSIALLISGMVRVYKIGENGREITLYRFGSGESCVLTAGAILNHHDFPAIATVEQDAEAVMVPAQAFRSWVRNSDLWREFAFELLSERLSSLMQIVDQVTFWRLDARLAGFLLNRSQQGNPLHITHQEIAAELGSAREVISRLLQDFSNTGLLQLGRGSIEILDFNRLKERASR